MKKLLFILLIIGVLIMLRPINAIIKDNVGNIIHRGFVVTGEVTKDNGNKSYDVKIAGEEKEYPRIFTLARNPDLEVGDTVRILYKNGCKELPIILPPVKPTAPTIFRGYALIVASPDELQVFDMDGALLIQIVVDGWSYAGCGVTMDSEGNVYIEEDFTNMKKFDSNGNLLVELYIEDISNWIESITFYNGHFYTLEGRDEFTVVAKRSPTDLTIIEDIVISDDIWEFYNGGLGIDSDGNFYVYDSRDDELRKFSSTGVLLAQLNVGTLSEYAGIVVCGSNVYFTKSSRIICYAPLNLSGYSTWNLVDDEDFAYCLTVADNHLILSGWDGDGDGATAKYDSDRNLIWTVKLTAASYAYKAGSYNF